MLKIILILTSMSTLAQSGSFSRPFRFLILGQSSAVGSNVNDSTFPENADVSVYPEVKIWNNSSDDTNLITLPSGNTAYDPQGSFEPWDLNAIPRQISTNSPINTKSNNALFAFAREVFKCTGNTVECIMSARGAQPVTFFSEENSGGFSYLKLQIDEAGWEEDTIDGVIWIQGENDHGTAISQYEVDFIKMRALVSTLSQASDATPFYVVRLRDDRGAQNEFFKTLEARVDYPFKYIDEGDLSGNDLIHFGNDALDTIGVSIFNSWSNNGIYVPPVDSPSIQIKSSNGNAIIFFSGNLEYSDDLSVWVPIASTSSPHIEPLSSTGRFFRAYK